ncbi:MAG: c-type cytochrome [Magnetococcales bacterium]|nr:c-type cytochrome [Magnetococcales bacterium]
MILTLRISLFLLLLLCPAPSFAGDPEMGEQLTKRYCSGCHRFGPRFSRMNHSVIGPSIASGVLGKKMGQVADYRYSKTMRNVAKKNLTWNEKNLDQFLSNPGQFFEKTGMSAFRGVSDPEERADLIAFLVSLGR